MGSHTAYLSGDTATSSRQVAKITIMNLTIIDKDTGLTYWTAHDCARYLDIAVDTWSSYVSRRQAPQSVGYYDKLRVWSAYEVEAWNQNRRKNK